MNEDIPSIEKVKFFRERTNKHIKLVKENLMKVAEVRPEYKDQFMKRAEKHDQTKFTDELFIPYIWITWMYKCKQEGIPFTYPSGMEQKANEVTKKHVLSEPHHPEYWAGEAPIDTNNRDQSVKAIDCTSMQGLDIIEMVCDWQAVGQERGNSAREWFIRNVPSRWIFDDNQIKIIDATLKIFESGDVSP